MLLAVIGFCLVTMILIFVEKGSKYVKFHSIQAFALVVVLHVCYILCYILWAIVVVLTVDIPALDDIIHFGQWIPLLPPIAIWIFLVIQCIKAFQNEEYKVPLIGKMCAKWAGGTR